MYNLEKFIQNKFMKRKVIWKILIYFIIYSVAGFFIETIYAIFTKGMLESRQSFLYGPFCIVYGIAAIFLICLLNKYKDRNGKLFFYGMVVGCLVEYFSSYIGEELMHVKWWDYSNDFLNINGRTCLYYAVLWGILTVILIDYINPYIDKIIDKAFSKISNLVLKICIALITVFMTFDGFLTCYALENFLVRVSNEYNITINGIEENIESSEKMAKLFSNEKMMMTYPNIIVVNDKNEVIYLESVLKDVKNYYYKFGFIK